MAQGKSEKNADMMRKLYFFTRHFNSLEWTLFQNQRLIDKLLVTGYSFWDRLCIFYSSLHELICQFIIWTNWVNSGKFMANCWISCHGWYADMEKNYDDLIIINLYTKHRFFLTKNSLALCLHWIVTSMSFSNFSNTT